MTDMIKLQNILEIQDILIERLNIANDTTLSEQQRKEESAKTSIVIMLARQYIALVNAIARACSLPANRNS